MMRPITGITLGENEILANFGGELQDIVVRAI
jgi:hypothetical protein